MRPGLALLAVLMLGFGACAGPIAQAKHCPVTLVPSREIAQPVPRRYRASFTLGERVVRLEIVSSREADRWIVVGHTAFGARLFALQQEGRAVKVSGDDLARAFGLDPLHVLDALHRASLISPPSTARSWERAGERVTETWRDGRLVSRSFEPVVKATPGGSAAAIRIEYIDPRPAGVAASWKIRNPTCGYEALVVLLLASPSSTN